MLGTYLAGKLDAEVTAGPDYTPPAGVHVSLHTADPAATGANALTGAARVAASFTANTGGGRKNAADLVWQDLPAGTVTHVGVWDAATGGNFLYGGALADPVTVAAGQGLRIAAGALVVGFTHA